MTIGTNFIRGSNPVWYMVDLVGKQFDDSFYLWVLTNTVPYIPAPVYHDLNGLIPWTAPIRFLANGTLPIDIFYDESMVYRLEIRKNDGLNPPSQADALIYLVENYTPDGAAGSQPLGSGIISGNQITNPQFSLVNFQGTFNLAATNPPSVEIAPGWFIDMTGTGTLTVEQNALNTASSNPTNAPYALHITTTGWNNPPVLRQRFAQNGMNWQNKTVALSVTARIDNNSQQILGRLVASNGTPIGPIINPMLTNAFVEYQGNVLVPAFANLNIPPNAYLELQISIPQAGSVYLTSIQVTESATATNVEYQQDTINRQLDHTFNYYSNKLQYKPIPSYLVGWDFPKNPGQLGYTFPVFAGANGSQYTWDQTIIYQTLTNSMSVARSNAGEYVITSHGGGQVALVQYLLKEDVQDILSGNVSVNISGFTNQVGGIAGTVSLWVSDGTALPVITGGAKPSLIATMDANGLPATLNACTGAVVGWTQITRQNGLNGKFILGNQLANVASEYNDIALNSFGLNNAGALTSATGVFFAIVVGFATLADTKTITLSSISSVPGDIATRPATKTTDETRRECNKYYWKTFSPATVPAQSAGIQTGEFIFPATIAGNATPNKSTTLFFPAVMATPAALPAQGPAITYYNPAAANAQVRDESAGADCSATTTYSLTPVSLSFITTGVGGGAPTAIGNQLGVHITASARPGIEI